jgi:hypothetical protein
MKKTFVFILAFLVLFVWWNSAVMQAYDVETYPVEKAETFDDALSTDYREKINKEKPGIVAIGDSAIRELDPEIFTEVLGEKTLIFSAPGSGSAYWYLFFLHQILEAKNKPEVVLFFFRTVTLTNPSYLVTGNYYTRLEEIASAEDKDVYEQAIGSTKSSFLKIPERYVPLFAYRSEVYQNIVVAVRNWLPGLLLNCDVDCVNNAFDQVFDDFQINAFLWEELVSNMDSDLDNEENYDFNARVEESFLPLILRDARKAGITPVFIRNKYRSQARGEPDSELMTRYMDDLKHYIEQNGGVFIDLGNIEELQAHMYRDQLHFSYEDAPRASEIISGDIKDHLEFLLK